MGILLAVLLLSVTAGWENVSPERRPFPPAEVLWSADLSRSADFTWELREGAAGTVEVSPQGIRIEKTNDAGYIVVKAAPFAVRKGRTIRCYADQESADADVNYSSGVVRGYGREENLAIDFALERRNFWDGGVQTMRGLPCTPPGQPYRKYGDFMSVHCLRPGRYTLRLPFPAQVANLKSRQQEKARDRSFEVNLTAGETCRFLLKPLCVQ